ncbi:MAG: FAD-dependent oxidoreductase [Planctomycetota bacterium]
MMYNHSNFRSASANLWRVGFDLSILRRRIVASRCGIAILLLLLWMPNGLSAKAKKPVKCGVLIYGATPAGIAASVTAARRDPSLSIVLITRYRQIGGIITNGLNHPDFRTFEARTGLYREINRRVEEYYRAKFGDDAQQVRDSLQGTHAGPGVNQRVFQGMIDQCPAIRVLVQHHLEDVMVGDRKVRQATFRSASGEISFLADCFVDATYEGDLLAAANVPYAIGREASETYSETLAPKNADDQLQGYNFRITMTDRPSNRAAIPRPSGYNRDEYLPLLKLIEEQKIPRIFGDPYQGLGGRHLQASNASTTQWKTGH